MTFLRNLAVEYRSSLSFGTVAFILSLLIGFIAQVRPGVILIRSLYFTLIFAGIGYAIVYVLKRFTPEVYESLGDISVPAAAPAESTAETLSEEVDAGAAEEGSPVETPTAESFRELKDDDFNRFDSAGATGVNTREGKLGKHIFSQENFGRYEPKLMAAAVRTMLKKDED